jgi:peptidoglycan/xylan/chitin deacetylase (PgdA/CDA1 family)
MKKQARQIVLKTIYLSGLWKVFKYFNRNRIAVLMYHGLTDREAICWTQVNINRFAEQMNYIKREYNPISLKEAVSALESGRPAEYGVVVTFDDGYANNASLAYPILKKHEIPAAIFLMTSLLDRDGPYGGFMWTDYVYALLGSTEKREADLGRVELGSYVFSALSDACRVKDDICGRLKKVSDDRKNAAIDGLERELGKKIDARFEAEFGGMTWSEARRLAADELIEFGAHTVNHVILSRVPENMMHSEIIDSKGKIEAELSGEVTSFAYPNGRREDFNSEVRKVVAENFDCAVTTIEGFNRPGDDLYELKRIGIGNDLTFWEFKLRLSGTIDFLKGLIRSENRRR